MDNDKNLFYVSIVFEKELPLLMPIDGLEFGQGVHHSCHEQIHPSFEFYLLHKNQIETRYSQYTKISTKVDFHFLSSMI